MEDISFFINHPNLLALGHIRLLKSQSAKISSIDLKHNGYRFALKYKPYRYEVDSGLKLSVNFMGLK